MGADERVSRGQASERAVCVCEAVSVEMGARRPSLPTAVVCPPGRRRRLDKEMARTKEIISILILNLGHFVQFCGQTQKPMTFFPPCSAWQGEA